MAQMRARFHQMGGIAVLQPVQGNLPPKLIAVPNVCSTWDTLHSSFLGTIGLSWYNVIGWSPSNIGINIVRNLNIG